MVPFARLNHPFLLCRRTFLAVISGTATGVLGLTGFNGFLGYLVGQLAASFLVIMASKGQPKRYFKDM